jgi:hypothetical protein
MAAKLWRQNEDCVVLAELFDRKTCRERREEETHGE